jgi:hypothetical protein
LLYVHDGDRQDFRCLDHIREGNVGVWFLAQPVTGEPAFTGTKTEHFPNGESWRSEANVTNWRYMVIESDDAPQQLWLKAIVHLRAKISAICTSGGKSIHALLRVDQPSKAAWDGFRDSVKKSLVEIGSDPNSLTAVRLTRLPGCRRGQTGRMQQLLYLNPQPTDTPIINLEPTR